MPWFPVGPNFVFAPIVTGFKRLSRRNEAGRQGLVSAIAVDPTDPDYLYVAIRPSTGGAAAFRSADGGNSWTAISDALQQSDPTVSPTALAVNPANPAIVYLATEDGRCFTSSARGDPGSWSAAATLGGSVGTLLVDPNTAANPATTVLYAAGSDGVWQSTDGGAHFTQVHTGDVQGFVGDFTSPGTPRLYAGVTQTGVLFTSNPSGTWTNLNAQNIGLPAWTAPTAALPDGNFNRILLGRCPANGRLYALFAQRLPGSGGFPNEALAGLYTSAAPQASWTQVTLGSPPEPAYGFYDFSFAVAPNSPGDGTSDILFFGTLGLSRSTNAGQSWVASQDDFHADHHAFGFAPAGYNGGAVPDTFIGCDGGIARSDRFADPAFDFGQSFSDFDAGAGYSDTGAPENLNHGLQSPACLGYGADRSMPALSYIGCQDTGLSGGAASLGWRGLEDADGNQVAAALGPSGMSVWNVLGEYGGWPTFQVHHWTDQGGYSSPAGAVTMPAAGNSLVAATSNMTVGLDGLCLAGLAARNQVTTLSAAVATGTQTAQVGSTAAIAVGARLVVDSGAAQETVVASAVTASSFTAAFANAHAAGAPVVLERQVVGRMDHSGQAVQVSQDFGNASVVWVAASPVDANQLYCVTGDQQLWHTSSGASAGATTVWTAMPAGISGYNIASVAVDHAGSVFVLMLFPVTTGGGEFTTTTPLFRADAGSWTPIACTGLPGGGAFFGHIVADPRQAGTLYATSNASVFQIVVTGNNAAWTSVSAGLPGGTISDLWAAAVSDVRKESNAITLLRAAVPTRGVWELALPDPSSAAPLLYVRDNVADLGWIDTAQDGGPDPYSAGGQIWHYQCADIKVDARQPASGSVPAFFQTDPEASSLPISQVAFDALQDNSQNLPAGDAAMVHVQVHNRSTGTATGVKVWAIACNASAGVPPLSTASFNFWSQFHSTGDIVPALPPGSPWTPIGPPIALGAVDAFHPQVASWTWTAPALGPGDSGHYCVMAFVHSAAAPLALTATGGDEAAVASAQVGQKNLHIGPPLLPSPGPGGGGTPGGRPFREVVDFWNPTKVVREAALVFDLRGLHRNVRSTLFFTRLDTVTPLLHAVTGYTKVVSDPLRHAGLLGRLLEEAWRLFDRVEDRLEDAVRRFFGLGHEHDPDHCSIDLPPGFEPAGWVAQRGSILAVKGVRIPPGGRVRALLNLESAGPLPPGAVYRVEVQQTVAAALVGGSTFVVRVAGTAKAPPSLEPSDDQVVSDAGRFIQPWLHAAWQARQKQQGRRL
jgi:hypothetical protein